VLQADPQAEALPVSNEVVNVRRWRKVRRGWLDFSVSSYLRVLVRHAVLFIIVLFDDWHRTSPMPEQRHLPTHRIENADLVVAKLEENLI
jgi:hypothetical protein